MAQNEKFPPESNTNNNNSATAAVAAAIQKQEKEKEEKVKITIRSVWHSASLKYNKRTHWACSRGTVPRCRTAEKELI